MLENKRVFLDIFKSVDENSDGVLMLREFRSLFRDPRVTQVLGRSLQADEFVQLFEGVDVDGDGVLSFEEVEAGLQNIWKMEMTKGRAQSFFERLLSDADKAKKGVVSIREITAIFSRPAVRRKVVRLMLDLDAVDDYLESLRAGVSLDDAEQFSSRDVNALDIHEIAEDLMKLRTPRPVEKWKILLKQVFQTADSDGSNSLNKEEFKMTFRRPSILAKFEKQGLKPTFFDGLFDLLDQDGSGDISEPELAEGFVRMWEAQVGIANRTPTPDNRANLARAVTMTSARGSPSPHGRASFSGMAGASSPIPGLLRG